MCEVPLTGFQAIEYSAMKVSRHPQIVTNCPKCGNVVLVPSGVLAQTIVRCPKCKSQYSIESALPEDVEELEIVGGQTSFSENGTGRSYSEDSENEPAPKIEATKFEVPTILRQGAKRRASRQRTSEKAAPNGSTNADPNSNGVHEISTQRFEKSGPSHQKSRSRSRRRSSFSEGNRSLEIVKIVLGAFLALPVAQLIIWWGLGVDPLGLGPSVGRSFPSLVPKSMRAEEKPETVNGLDIRSPD